MFRAMYNVQEPNEDTHVLSTKLKNNEEEDKKCEDKDSESCVQPTTRNTDTNGNENKRKKWLDLSSQFDAVFEVYKATMQLTLENLKLATYDLCNNTVEKSAKTHRDNILNNFIQKGRLKYAVEETTRLIENEPRLEESAIRNVIRNDVNKSTKRVAQRILSKYLLIQSKWCKLIVEN